MNAPAEPLRWPARERRVSLQEILDSLVIEKIVAPDAAEKMRADARLKKTAHHPLELVADQKWKSLAEGKPLTLDWLSEWMARRSGMEYFHIDPLKIDFTRVGDTMSITYAQRFSMLPVAINSKELTVATSEPFRKTLRFSESGFH